MNSNDVVLRFIESFDRLSIPYMLTGSLASSFYGVPRLMYNASFLARSTDQIFEPLLAYFMDEPRMSVGDGRSPRCIFFYTERRFRIELFLLSDDPHDQTGFGRRRIETFEGRKVWMPTAEDIIITKLRWLKQGKRHKDVDDVAGVIAVQAQRLDLPYIRRWCDQHGTRELLERLLEMTPR